MLLENLEEVTKQQIINQIYKNLDSDHIGNKSRQSVKQIIIKYSNNYISDLFNDYEQLPEEELSMIQQLEAKFWNKIRIFYKNIVAFENFRRNQFSILKKYINGRIQ